MKKILASVLLAALVLVLAGCGAEKMPFNGPIEFHDITVTVPRDFVRDSTQSTKDVRVFEKGIYKEIIIITRSDLTEDADTALQAYAVYMSEQGADTSLAMFLEQGAVHSTYTKDGTFCQEMLFIYNGSIYTIALRGGTQEDFQALLNTAGII